MDNPESHGHYTLEHGGLHHKGRIVISATCPWIPKIASRISYKSYRGTFQCLSNVQEDWPIVILDWYEEQHDRVCGNLLGVPTTQIFGFHQLLKICQMLVNLPQTTVFFEFHPDVCCIKSQLTTYKGLLQGIVGVDELYLFHNLKLQHNSFVLLSSSKSFYGSSTHSSLQLELMK